MTRGCFEMLYGEAFNRSEISVQSFLEQQPQDAKPVSSPKAFKAARQSRPFMEFSQELTIQNWPKYISGELQR